MRKGWEYKRLDECANIEYGTRVVQKKDSGTLYPVYGGGGETFKMDKFNREDCLIVARFAMSRRCVRFVNGKFFLNDSGLSVKAGDKLYQSYLNYNIISLNDDIYHLGKGAAQRNLDVKLFKKLTIAIPPLSTQIAIVSELDKINELIRLKKEQLKDFDNLAQSLFCEMFGDPVENEKGWEVKKLGEIGEFKNGLNFSKDENGHSIKFLGVSDFQNKKSIASDQLAYISLSERVQEDYLLKTGDIVFVRSNGKKELIGRSVKMYITEPTTYSGFCIRCRITDEKVDKDYIAILLKTPIIRQFMTNSGRGCNISNLNQKVLTSIPTILPPLPLQRLFAQRIEQIEREKSEVQKSIQDLETLLASRMQYWFE